MEDLNELGRMQNGALDRVALLLRQLPGAVWVADSSLHITELALGAAATLCELSEAAAIGATVAQLIGRHSATALVLEHHQRALRGETSTFAFDKGGRTFEAHVRPLLDQERVVGVLARVRDVTERVCAERAREASERRLLEAQRLGRVGSWEWQVDRRLITGSPEFFQIYGIDPATFDGTYEAVLERVHEDDREPTRAAAEKAYLERRPFSYAHRIVGSGGELRMVRTQGSVVIGPDGAIERMVGSCFDITDQWSAQLERERALALLQSVLHSIEDGVLVIDLAGKVTTCNQPFLALWQIPPEVAATGNDEVLLKHVTDQLEDPEEFHEKIREYYAKPEAEGADTIRFKDGRVFERHTRPHRLNERVLGRVWSFHDVTEEARLLERATCLSDASRLLASLDLESALEGLARRCVPQLAAYCACDLFLEGGPRRVVTVQQEGAPAIEELTDLSHPTNQIHRAPDAPRSWMLVPILMHGRAIGRFAFVAPPRRGYTHDDEELARELAARAALAIESHRQYQRAQDALRQRQEFLSIVAHEIRGPMTSLHLAIQGLQRGAIPAAESKRVLELIEREGRRVGRFLDELLDVGRIQAGRFSIELEEVDLGEVVNDVVGRLGRDFTRTGATITLEHGGQITGTWDRHRLDQVVTNLVSNALKYGEGKPISVRTSATDGFARLSVTDHGIGIPPQRLEEVFQPFERAVGARQYGGIGLGLYIVRTIVEQLGGKVSVESRLGEGSTFTVELPRARVKR